MFIPVGLIITLIIHGVRWTFIGLVAAVAGIFYAWRALLGSMTKPPGHGRVGAASLSRGYQELLKGGFTITPDWRSTAMKSLPKN